MSLPTNDTVVIYPSCTAPHAVPCRLWGRRRAGHGYAGRGRRQRRGGFTLLELLLVLAILVVIGGIVGTNLIGAGAAANADATRTQLNSLKSSIQMFQIRMNGLPQTLEELRDGPSDAAKQAKWVAPIITEIPTDAWGNEITYQVNGNAYELRSNGIDGQSNTDDDIIVNG